MSVDIIKSTLATLAYTFSQMKAKAGNIAAEVARRYANGLTDEAKAELEQGIALHKAELTGERHFVLSGTSAEEVSAENGKAPKAPKGATVLTLTRDMACNLSTYDYGKMGQDDPARKAAYKVVREDCQKYESNTMKELERKVADILKGGTGKGARTPSSFAATYMGRECKMVNDALTRRNNAAKRGEPGIPSEATLKAALAAYETTLQDGLKREAAQREADIAANAAKAAAKAKA
jgi:hypothetical protein